LAQFNFIAPTIAPSGTTWAQLKTGGLKILLDNLVAANASLANPTVAATTAETVAAGGLAAGQYYAAYTFLDAFGETAAGGESARFTVTDTAHLTTITLPAKPSGCQAINVYITPVGGASGSETLYATGITGTTLACTFAFPANQPGATAPTVNTTGAAAHTTRLYNLFTLLPGTEGLTMRATEDVSNILSGRPMAQKDVYGTGQMWLGLASLFTRAWTEFNTLLAANFPNATLATGTTAIGMPVTGWILP
jgi:hypothetical protein